MVYQAKIAPDRSGFQMSSVIGGSNPAYRAGAGKALLMNGPRDRVAVEAFVAAYGPLERRTPSTIRSAAALHEALTVGRRVGYALDLEENEVGAGCLTIPLFLDSPVVPTGAISISAVTSRTSVDELVARLDQVRAIITAELGDVLRGGPGDADDDHHKPGVDPDTSEKGAGS